MEIRINSQGKPFLCLDGYEYHRDNNKEDKVYWKCANKCSGRACSKKDLNGIPINATMTSDHLEGCYTAPVARAPAEMDNDDTQLKYDGFRYKYQYTMNDIDYWMCCDEQCEGIAVFVMGADGTPEVKPILDHNHRTCDPKCAICMAQKNKKTNWAGGTFQCGLSGCEIYTHFSCGQYLPRSKTTKGTASGSYQIFCSKNHRDRYRNRMEKRGKDTAARQNVASGTMEDDTSDDGGSDSLKNYIASSAASDLRKESSEEDCTIISDEDTDTEKANHPDPPLPDTDFKGEAAALPKQTGPRKRQLSTDEEDQDEPPRRRNQKRIRTSPSDINHSGKSTPDPHRNQSGRCTVDAVVHTPPDSAHFLSTKNQFAGPSSAFESPEADAAQHETNHSYGLMPDSSSRSLMQATSCDVDTIGVSAGSCAADQSEPMGTREHGESEGMGTMERAESAHPSMQDTSAAAPSQPDPGRPGNGPASSRVSSTHGTEEDVQHHYLSSSIEKNKLVIGKVQQEIELIKEKSEREKREHNMIMDKMQVEMGLMKEKQKTEEKQHQEKQKREEEQHHFTMEKMKTEVALLKEKHKREEEQHQEKQKREEEQHQEKQKREEEQHQEKQKREEEQHQLTMNKIRKEMALMEEKRKRDEKRQKTLEETQKRERKESQAREAVYRNLKERRAPDHAQQ